MSLKTSDEIVRVLTQHREDLALFYVQSLSVFGSVGLFHFIRLKMFLESLLGRHVDLVTPDALKAGMRDQILRDAIRAA